jgi:phosphate transport system protein
MDNLKISQHISKRYNAELEDIRSRVLAMGGLVEEQLKEAMLALENLNEELARNVIDNDVKVNALDAFTHLDTEKAVKVWSEDRFVDREYESLIRELMTYMMEDPHSIPVIVKAMSVTRAIEHIGDRASNIREYIIYLVKGRNVRHTRVDRHAEG